MPRRKRFLRTLETWRPALHAVLGSLPPMVMPEGEQMSAAAVLETMTSRDPRLLDARFREKAEDALNAYLEESEGILPEG